MFAIWEYLVFLSAIQRVEPAFWWKGMKIQSKLFSDFLYGKKYCPTKYRTFYQMEFRLRI